MSDQPPTEPSLLEWARHAGLTVNYLKHQPLIDARTRQTCADEVLSSMASWDSTIWAEQPPDVSRTDRREQLSISNSALELLKDVCSLPEANTTALLPPTVSRPSARSLKLELPLLATDNECDVLHFGRTTTLDMNHIQIPLIPMDAESDEGMGWSSDYRRLPAQADEQLRTEKLEISHQGLAYLRDTVVGMRGAADPPSMVDASSQRHKTRLARRPLTPPLLPLSPPLAPFSGRAPLKAPMPWRDTTDDITAEHESIKQTIMEEDQLLELASSLENGDGSGTASKTIPKFLEVICVTPPTMLSPKRKLQDSKVEGPLTPQLPSEMPWKRHKGMSVSEMLHEIGQELPSSFMNAEDLGLNDVDLSQFIREEIEPLAVQAVKSLENEQLVEADTTKRVKVPEVATRVIVPPWLTFSRSKQKGFPRSLSELDAQRELLRRAKDNEMDLVRRWHGNAQIERELTWTPFPLELGKVDTNERIYAAEVDQIIADIPLSETIDSASLTWKREGLRILSDAWDSDEEELTPTELTSDAARLDDIILTPTFNDELLQHPPHNLKDASQEKKSMSLAEPWNPIQNTWADDDGLLFGGSFLSPAEIVGHLRGEKDVIAPQHRSVREPQRNLPPQLAPGQASSRTDITSPNTRMIGQTAPLMPFPVTAKQLPERPFILCANLFASRADLLRAVEKLYPAAYFIDRNGSHLELQRHDQQSAASHVRDEGDIIVSPATTIVLTTLAKIKQRPLPGQEHSHYGLKQRITDVAHHFERVIVLISEGLPDGLTENRVLDSKDVLAVAELAGSLSNLEAECKILYVPGGDTELAKWLVALMDKYGMPPNQAEGLTLLQEQTLWELFLRRLGLNSFAAQAVLTTLKPAPFIDNHAESSEYAVQRPQEQVGLGGFITMSPDERLRQLSPALGGQKLLKRANKLLEMAWMR